MKKSIFVVLVLVIVLGLSACNKPAQFEDGSAMLASMEGMWLLEDSSNTYYIFEQGNIYTTTANQYTSLVEDMLEKALSVGGAPTWSAHDFSVVSGKMSQEELLIRENDNVTLYPHDGEIVFNEGQSFQKKIVINGSSVSLVREDEDSGTPLTKISDAKDFTGERFVQLFEKTKQNFSSSSSNLLMRPDKYFAYLKTLHPEMVSWVEVENVPGMYTYNGKPTASNYVIVTDDSVLYCRGVIEGNANFMVLYDTSRPNAFFVLEDQYDAPLSQLLAYAEPILGGLPGALDPSELFNWFAQSSTVTGDVYDMLEETHNSITYDIMRSTDGGTTLFTLDIEETVNVSSIMEETELPYAPDPENSGEFNYVTEKLHPYAVWRVPWHAKTAMFVFDLDGACYMAIKTSSNNEEPKTIGAGIGTYTVEEDRITISLVMDDASTVTYTYGFDPYDYKFIQLSENGLSESHSKGASLEIKQDYVCTPEELIDLAQSLTNT